MVLAMCSVKTLKDPTKWCELVESFANNALTDRQYDKARKYLEYATKLARHAKDQNRENTLKAKLTDSFVDQARGMRGSGAKPLLLSDRYAKAIEACQRHGGKRNLIDELHAEMNEIHQQIPAELKRIEVSVDVTAAGLVLRSVEI